jgi:beta-lactamase class A
MLDKSRRCSRIAAFVFLVAVLALACGVPISDAEITATAGGGLQTNETPRAATATAPSGTTLTPAPSPPGPPATGTPNPFVTPTPAAAFCDDDNPPPTMTPPSGIPRPAGTPSARIRPPSGVRAARAFDLLPVVPDARLDAALQEAIGDARDSYAVVVKDLTTGVGASVNADRVFYAASVYKMAVMYEAFNQVAQGLLDLNTELQITPYYEAFGLGPRATVLCQRLTVQAALEAMMAISDNATAVLLQDVIGAGNINASMAALGLKETRLLPEDLPLTAADMAVLLEGIGRGLAIDAASSEAMLRLMLGERIDNGIRGGVPAGTAVAHKTGNWNNATHDVAIVYSPKATYALAVLSDRDHETVVTRAISRAVYQFFNP